MARGPEIYLKSAVRRWKRELEKAQNTVVVLSPYLTSETAELVLQSTQPDSCEIYTSFSAENFATGASSIRTLRTLSDAGYRLYDLPQLHAKIVLVPGQCATIGSQNLTRGGTINKEASVVITDPATIAAVEKYLHSWTSSRQAITSEMISEIESLLPTLVRKSSALRKQLLLVETEVRANQKKRDREQNRRLARHRTYTERLRRFRAQLAAMPRAQEVVVARVCTVMQAGWFLHHSTENNTLLAGTQNNLTRWSMGDSVVRLARLTRYLCLIEDDGRFGWARVGKTRITFVHSSITGLKVELGELECGLEFKALSEEVTSGQNLRIRLLLPNSASSVEVTAWFAIDRLSVASIHASRRSFGLYRLKRWIQDHEGEFCRIIVSRLVEPFRYEHNRAGVEATGFFGPVDTRVRLRIGLIGDNPVLQAKTV